MLNIRSKNFRLNLCLIINLIALVLIAYFFVASKISFFSGVLTMSYLSISTVISVYLTTNQRSAVFSSLLILAKVPVTLLIIYTLNLKGLFEPFSFVIGVLIVLPILVILSYRKYKFKA